MKEFKLINEALNDVIENNCCIKRDYTLNDEDFEENCHCTDSGMEDIAIASLQYGNKRFSIETTCNKWNLYLWEETCKDGYWETIDCNNITGDQEEWKTIIDVNNYLFNLFGLDKYIIERN